MSWYVYWHFTANLQEATVLFGLHSFSGHSGFSGCWFVVLCLCDTFTPCDTCTPAIIQLRQTTEHGMFITSNPGIWHEKQRETRERDRWPTALIVSVADTSNNQHLYWHTIQISSHRHLWYCSRHCLFDVPHVCHKVTVPHPPPPPHIHN